MEILIRPIVTEKMTEQGEKLNKIGFVVNKNANKLQIRNAVEEMYSVTVESVSTLIARGKTKTRYSRSGIIEGKTKSYKKAIVTLAEGDEIDFFSNI